MSNYYWPIAISSALLCLIMFFVGRRRVFNWHLGSWENQRIGKTYNWIRFILFFPIAIVFALFMIVEILSLPFPASKQMGFIVGIILLLVAIMVTGILRIRASNLLNAARVSNDMVTKEQGAKLLYKLMYIINPILTLILILVFMYLQTELIKNPEFIGKILETQYNLDN